MPHADPPPHASRAPAPQTRRGMSPCSTRLCPHASSASSGVDLLATMICARARTDAAHQAPVQLPCSTPRAAPRPPPPSPRPSRRPRRLSSPPPRPRCPSAARPAAALEGICMHERFRIVVRDGTVCVIIRTENGRRWWQEPPGVFTWTERSWELDEGSPSCRAPCTPCCTELAVHRLRREVAREGHRPRARRAAQCCRPAARRRASSSSAPASSARSPSP